MGPISPAAKKPAIGSGPKARAIASASWCGWLNIRVPRPLQVKSRPPWRRRVLCGSAGQKLLQFGIGGFLVADVKLHGLAGADVVADRDRTAARIDADDVAHEKISLLEPLLVLADDAADVQRRLHQPLLASGQGVEDLAKLHQGRLAAQLVNDVSLGLGDDEWLADRAAALRDDRPHADRAGHVDGDRSFGQCLPAKDQPVVAWLVRRRWPCRR